MIFYIAGGKKPCASLNHVAEHVHLHQQNALISNHERNMFNITSSASSIRAEVKENNKYNISSKNLRPTLL